MAHWRRHGDPAHYHLCPTCWRATPAAARERFCPNDGQQLLTACPACRRAITSPYSRYCAACGAPLSAEPQPDRDPA